MDRLPLHRMYHPGSSAIREHFINIYFYFYIQGGAENASLFSSTLTWELLSTQSVCFKYITSHKLAHTRPPSPNPIMLLCVYLFVDRKCLPLLNFSLQADGATPLAI